MAEVLNDRLSEAGESRRRALKAGVGLGVGAIAWSGPTITSLGGTPAYAAACTNFTADITIQDMSTNQQSGCSPWAFNNSPNLDGEIRKSLGLPGSATVPYTTDLPDNGNFACANVLTCSPYKFFFPDDETCTVTVKIAENKKGLTGPWYGEATVGPVAGGELTMCFPASTEPVNANSRWNVFIQCVKTSQADCLGTPTP